MAALFGIGISIIFIAFLGIIFTIGIHFYRQRKDKTDSGKIENGHVVAGRSAYASDSFPM